MVVGGIACTTSDVDGATNDYTLLNPYNTIDINGTINGWCFKSAYFGAPGSLKLKIFRINGANYDYVGESSYVDYDKISTIYTGYCNISVLAGDLVGVYISAGRCGLSSSSEISKYISGDIITNTAQSGWTNFAGNFKLIVRVGDDYSTYSNVYVDINKADDTGAGNSWSTAKKTMKAGWDILNPTGTLHVASGDYSGQTGITYNKSWFLSPEDPNATGAKNVKIPPSV